MRTIFSLQEFRSNVELIEEQEIAEKFAELVDRLPVVGRNQLDRGQAEQLLRRARNLAPRALSLQRGAYLGAEIRSNS